MVWLQYNQLFREFHIDTVVDVGYTQPCLLPHVNTHMHTHTHTHTHTHISAETGIPSVILNLICAYLTGKVVVHCHLYSLEGREGSYGNVTPIQKVSCQWQTEIMELLQPKSGGIP